MNEKNSDTIKSKEGNIMKLHVPIILLQQLWTQLGFMYTLTSIYMCKITGIIMYIVYLYIFMKNNNLQKQYNLGAMITPKIKH